MRASLSAPVAVRPRDDDQDRVEVDHDELREIAARLGRIEIMVGRLLAQQPVGGHALTAKDRDALGILVPAVSKCIGSAPFTARSLVDDAHAEHADGLLRAIDRAIGIDRGTTRRLARLFGRASGFTVDGFLIERACDEKGQPIHCRDGWLFAIDAGFNAKET